MKKTATLNVEFVKYTDLDQDGKDAAFNRVKEFEKFFNQGYADDDSSRKKLEEERLNHKHFTPDGRVCLENISDKGLYTLVTYNYPLKL